LATPKALPESPGSRATHKAARAAPQHACRALARTGRMQLAFRLILRVTTIRPARKIGCRAGDAGESRMRAFYRHTQTGALIAGDDLARDRALRRGFALRRPPFILSGHPRWPRLGVFLADGRVTHATDLFFVRLLRKRLPREEIIGVAPVRNPWWWVGAFSYPRGWLYNVDGLEAVEVALSNGSALRIGSTRPGRSPRRFHSITSWGSRLRDHVCARCCTSRGSPALHRIAEFGATKTRQLCSAGPLACLIATSPCVSLRRRRPWRIATYTAPARSGTSRTADSPSTERQCSRIPDAAIIAALLPLATADSPRRPCPVLTARASLESQRRRREREKPSTPRDAA